MCSNQREINDGRELLKIFPSEVWLIIFDKLTTQDDQENFINSSLFLRNLLLSRRTEFLFKKVWKILGRKYEENVSTPGSVYREEDTTDNDNHKMDEDDSDDDSWNDNASDDNNSDDNDSDDHDSDDNDSYDNDSYDNDSDDNDSDERNAKNLLLKSVNRIRMVCRSWNNAILDYYQNHPLHFHLQNQHSDFYSDLTIAEKWTLSMIRKKFCGLSQEKVDLFLLQGANTHENGNPFFGKSVWIEFWLSLVGFDYENDIEFPNKIIPVLSKYGHHIWYCEISIMFASCRSAVCCYSRIREMLELMPKLKVLRLKTCTSDYVPNLDDVMEQLRNEICARPLPTLSDLRMLSIDTESEHSLIIQELIRSNGHITILDDDDSNCNIFSVPLPNLTTLCFDMAKNFEKLTSPQVKWPLSKLCASFDHQIEWQRVFALLGEKWSSSLTHLEIFLPSGNLERTRKLYEEGASLQLNLPHLKFFTIDMEDLVCLDFMLAFKDCLQFLKIKIFVRSVYAQGCLDVCALEKGSIIKLLSCADRPLESNIWSLFPKLERVDYDLTITQYGSGYRHIPEKTEKWSHNKKQWECKMKSKSD